MERRNFDTELHPNVPNYISKKFPGMKTQDPWSLLDVLLPDFSDERKRNTGKKEETGMKEGKER